MTGAPVLNGTQGSFISLLDAILVNGFGTRPPLGWSKPAITIHPSTPMANRPVHYASYRNAAPGQQNDLFFAYKNYSGTEQRVFVSRVDTFPKNVITRNIATTENSFYSQVNFFTVSATKDSTPRPWFAVGDDRRILLLVRTGYNPVNSAGNRPWSILFFGEFGTFSSATNPNFGYLVENYLFFNGMPWYFANIQSSPSTIGYQRIRTRTYAFLHSQTANRYSGEESFSLPRQHVSGERMFLNPLRLWNGTERGSFVPWVYIYSDFSRGVDGSTVLGAPDGPLAGQQFRRFNIYESSLFSLAAWIRIS
jgi:hypothetical protein